MGFVQGNKKSVSGVASTTLAFPSAVTAGNLLIATDQEPNTSATTASDNVNAGNYTATDNHSTANSANDLVMWFKANALAGSTTVTFASINASEAAGFTIGEYSGVVTSSPLDVHGATDANGSSITSGSLTSTGANGSLLVATQSSATQNVTVSNTTSGWSVDETNTPNATMDATLASRTQNPSGAFTTTFSVTGGAQDQSVLVAAFKLAAVGGATAGQITYAYSSN